MTEHEASRTLVKSPPELWAELSDQVALAGHLAEPFGEIRITRLEPETAVAWEGERASGTVRIEPSGWGTRVTLTARAHPGDPGAAERQSERRAEAPTPPPARAAEPPAPAAPEPRPPRPPRRGLLGFLLRRLLGTEPAPIREEPPATRSESAPARAVAPPAPQPPPAPPVAPPSAAGEPASAEIPARAEAATAPPVDPGGVLVAVLDRLGAAHHRPFSRA